MKEFFKSKELWTFVGGAVTAVVTSKFAKSNKARELAVKGLASGMQVKDNVELLLLLKKMLKMSMLKQ